jgi:hypothetical protein
MGTLTYKGILVPDAADTTDGADVQNTLSSGLKALAQIAVAISAARTPTANDDGVGTGGLDPIAPPGFFVNTATTPPTVYQCTSSATGAAVWQQVFPAVASGAGGIGLTPTAVMTAAYNANPSDLVLIDTTGGAVTITLPGAPVDKTIVAAKMIAQGGTNTVTIAAAGADVFNKTGGATSLTLTLLNQGVLLQYAATPAIWYVLGDDLPLAGADGRYVLQSSVSTASAASTLVERDASQNINAETFTVVGSPSSSSGVTGLTSPVNPSDAVSMSWVTNAMAGLSGKADCLCATTTNLAGAIYSNGSSGAGATLMAGANVAITAVASFDGQQANLALGSRVLVRDQTAPLQNGIYSVTQVGSGSAPWILTRTTDMDTDAQFAGAYVFVESGTTYGGYFFWTNPSSFAIGTTSVAWSQLQGPAIIAGTGISISGGTISIALTAGANISISGATLSFATQNSNIAAAGYTHTGLGLLSAVHLSGLNSSSPTMGTLGVALGIAYAGAQQSITAADGGGYPSDCAGQINLTTATTGYAAGIAATVNFTTPFTNAPIVILTPANGAASANAPQAYVSATTATGFTVRFNAAPAGTTLYAYNFFVMGING